MPRRKTTEEFIADAIKVHGDKYDYSKVVYVNNNTKVEVICPIHGSFFVLPRIHLSGCECPKCKGVDSDQEYFIERAKKIHDNKYDYSKVEYKKANEKVCIICKRCGKEFWQAPNSHLQGHGCECYAKEARSKASRGESVYGIGVNDYEGYIINKEGKYLPSYSAWMHMMRRCYSEDYRITNQTYKDCKVCEEWRYFSNFKKWFDDQSNGYIKGLELDKDLLIRGNKVYSPSTCCFLPQELNKLIMRHKSQRGEYMIGVYRREGGKRFWAQINSPLRKTRLIGIYDTEYEAFLAYKQEKEKTIKILADKYYNEGLITKKVYDALYAYQVTEDD